MEAQCSDVSHNKPFSKHRDKFKRFFSNPHFSHKTVFSLLMEFVLNICKTTT